MKKRFLSTMFLVTLGLFISCKNEVNAPPSSGIAPLKTDEIQDQNPTAVSNTTSQTVVEPKKLIAKEDLAIMTFEKESHDFGIINEGDKPEYTFVFKNTSKNDLIITNASGSCGCTVPEFPKEAIKPGQSSKIKVSFNSDGKPGKQEKSVTITANVANEMQIIRIKANVTPKKK